MGGFWVKSRMTDADENEGLIFRCRAIVSRGPWSFIATRYNRAAAKVSFKGIPDRVQNDGC